MSYIKHSLIVLPSQINFPNKNRDVNRTCIERELPDDKKTRMTRASDNIPWLALMADRIPGRSWLLGKFLFSVGIVQIWCLNPDPQAHGFRGFIVAFSVIRSILLK